MLNASFWKGAAERAVKTFAQSLVSVFAVGTALWDIPWWQALGVAGAAAVASLLTSIGSADFVSGNTPPLSVSLDDTRADMEAVESSGAVLSAGGARRGNYS